MLTLTTGCSGRKLLFLGVFLSFGVFWAIDLFVGVVSVLELSCGGVPSVPPAVYYM